MAKTALVIDDVQMNRTFLKSNLSFKGFKVDEAADGLIAYKKIKKFKKYDIIFSDIDMPNMNGLELLARLKRDPTLADLPVVMLTTHDSAEVIEKAKKLGAKYHLVKPLNENGLLAALDSLGL